MKISIVSDAWRPQVNGVVRTYEHVSEELERMGHELLMVTPEGFATIPCPTYPSIRLALHPRPKLRRLLREQAPEALHIATEGPLGQAARAYCIANEIPFTTSFHTQFPEYIRMRVPVPMAWTYAWMRRFHGRAQRTLVPTPSMRDRLLRRGFGNLIVWPRGVNSDLFRPTSVPILNLPRPVFAFSGRVAVEKNIEAFLKLPLPGSKLVIGDGPDLPRLRGTYPAVHFTGFRFGTELAALLGCADVFVFPSLTDTFGLVLLEAMACGVPVAAFPVTGPKDVVINGVTGILDQDLCKAALAALDLASGPCVEFARSHSWRRAADILLQNLALITSPCAETVFESSSG